MRNHNDPRTVLAKTLHVNVVCRHGPWTRVSFWTPTSTGRRDGFMGDREPSQRSVCLAPAMHVTRSLTGDAVITFRVRHSRVEMCSGHGRLCVNVYLCACMTLSVCLSFAAFPHHCMDPDVTCENHRCKKTFSRFLFLSRFLRF